MSERHDTGPDGYAVVIDDKSSPRGYWFSYAYIAEDIAKTMAAKLNGRAVPFYFGGRPENVDTAEIVYRLQTLAKLYAPGADTPKAMLEAAQLLAFEMLPANPERRSSLELSEVKPDGSEGRSGEVDREGGGRPATARGDAVGAGRAKCGPRQAGCEANQEGLTREDGASPSVAPSATGRSIFDIEGEEGPDA